jgi:hypothetical protein
VVILCADVKLARGATALASLRSAWRGSRLSLSYNMARALCQRVLKIAQSVDENAKIGTITKAAGLGGENARLVRIQCDSSTHKSVMSRLRDALPLSSVSLVENVVEGTFEAQVIFPEGATRRQLATLNVERRSWARCLKFATELFTIAGVGVASLAILARGLGI